MNVEIAVGLQADSALIKANALFNALDRAQLAAKQIRVDASNIKLPSLTGSNQSTSAMTALNTAIARQRATAATAQAATTQLNSALFNNVVASRQAALSAISLSNATARHTAQAQQNHAALNQQGGALASFGARLGSIAAGYLGFRAILSGIGESIRQSINIENLTNTLEATSGSALQAANDLAFLRSESDRIGINFLASSQAFVKFSSAVQSAGLSGQLARDTFVAISEAGRRLGLDAQQQGLAFLALEQMVSKGVVSMEELRRQLGNALPGAFQIAARSMGATTAEFNKMLEAGIQSSEFVPKFIEQLRKDLPATEETLGSTAAELSRLQNAWQLFMSELGRTPAAAARSLSGVVAPILEDVSAAMGNLEAQRKLQQVRNAQAELFGAASRSDAGGFFSRLGTEISDNSGLYRLFGNGADVERIIEQQNQLTQLEQKRSQLAQDRAQAARDGDVITEKDLERARVFNDIYATFVNQKLEGELQKRAEINSKFDDAIAKARKQLTDVGIGQELIDVITGIGEQGRNNALEALDLETWQKSIDEAEADWQDWMRQVRSDVEFVGNLKIRVIDDDEEQRIARVNAEFDQLNQTLKEIIARNPELVPEGLVAALQGARESALQPKNGFSAQQLQQQQAIIDLSRQSFSGLSGERNRLKDLLLTTEDAEEYLRAQQTISDVNDALALNFQQNSVGIEDSFKFGFSEIVESWGTASQRMATVGAELADNLNRNLTGLFVDLVEGTKKPKEAFADMARSITAELARVAVQELVVKSLISGLGFAGHGGMVIGMGGSTTQFAPRHHSGSGPIGDEKLIMARRDEVIFTPEQLKLLTGSKKESGKAVEIMNVFDERIIDQRIAANPDLILNAIGKRRSAVRSILA